MMRRIVAGFWILAEGLMMASGSTGSAAADGPGAWMAMSEWGRCTSLAGPGQIAEIGNDDGMSLFTPCTADVPKPPFDWTAPPSRFRLVVEPKPVHSTPLPTPQG